MDSYARQTSHDICIQISFTEAQVFNPTQMPESFGNQVSTPSVYPSSKPTVNIQPDLYRNSIYGEQALRCA
jgi:hypothetical protein